MEWLKEWMLWVFFKLQSLAYEAGDQAIGALLDALPENEGEGPGSTFGDYFSLVDGWFPLTEAIGLYGSLITFRVSLIAVKWMLKFIPTIG